jgi:CheY-like chemotaxis protein
MIDRHDPGQFGTGNRDVGPLRILYIEDNSLVREITCELLANENREVVALGSAEEGMVAYRDNRYDVVITDVNLPAMSGMDFVRQILKEVPGARVIITSGYSLRIDLASLGPHVRALMKPFDAPEIEALLASLCG